MNDTINTTNDGGDMSLSRLLSPKSDAAKKRAQRRRMSNEGKTQVDVWISAKIKDLLKNFTDKYDFTRLELLSLLIENVGPPYLRNLEKKLEDVLPVRRKLLVYESYRVPALEVGPPPFRIGSGPNALLLDPKEHFRLRQLALSLLPQVYSMGVSEQTIQRLLNKKKAKRRPKRAIKPTRKPIV